MFFPRRGAPVALGFALALAVVAACSLSTNPPNPHLLDVPEYATVDASPDVTPSAADASEDP